MNRMHPDDLRALVAAPLFAMNETITAANAVALADSLLAEIASTAKPEPAVEAMERAGAEQCRRADQNAQDMLDWRARAERAEFELARIVDGGVNQMLADLRSQVVTAKAEGARDERERIIEHICTKWTTDWFKAACEYDIHLDLQPPK